MLLRSLLTVLACACTTGPLDAEPAEIITYDSLPGRILASNPDLAAARLRVNEALGRLKQSGRLDNPNLETSLEHNRRFNEGRIELGVSQRFPLTQRLALEKKVNFAAVEAAEAEIREVARGITADARAAFVRVLSLKQQRELLLEQKRVSESLAESISEAAGRGEASALDAGQARLSAARLSTGAQRIDAEEITAAGTLRPLLGLPVSARLHLAGGLPDPAPPAARKSIDRPDLDLARIQARAAADELHLQQALRREDVEGGFFVAAERSEDAPDGRETEGIVGLRFRIPLPFWNRNEGAIDEAAARRERKELETLALAETIGHQAATARAEMARWKAMLGELDEKLLPLAREQTEALETAYHAGQSDLQSVLRSREQSLELAAARLDALREFHLARVRYDAATGHP